MNKFALLLFVIVIVFSGCVMSFKSDFSSDITAIISKLPDVDNSSITIIPFDFGNDSNPEYVAYFHKMLPSPTRWNGSTYDWNGAFQIYGQEGDSWKLLFSDEGNVGKVKDVASRFEADSFFTGTDLDEDGTPEAIITSYTEGIGHYFNQYILKMVEGSISRVYIRHSYTEDELAGLFLESDEAFGVEELGFIPVCASYEVNSWCTWKQGAPNASATITYDFFYRDGVFWTDNYERIEGFTPAEDDINEFDPADWTAWILEPDNNKYFSSYGILNTETYSGLTQGSGGLEVWNQFTLLDTLDTLSLGSVAYTVAGSLWSVFTLDTAEGLETRIYLISAGQCAPCVWPSRYYVAIDEGTQKVELREIPAETSSIFAGDLFLTSLSSSGKLAAFVSEDDNTKVFIYDLTTNTETEIFQAQNGQMVSSPDDDNWSQYLYFSWEGETLNIEPVFADSLEKTEKSYEWTSGGGLVEVF